MDTLIALAYIKKILDDTKVALIEVWDRVLYVRMNPGCGSGTFMSKLGLTFNLPVYYAPEKYRTVSKQFHPDTFASKKQKSTGNSKDKVSRETKQQSRLKKLQQHINVYKEELCNEFNRRTVDAIGYINSLSAFARFTSTSMSQKRDKLRVQLEQELDSAGLCNSTSFNEYSKHGVWTRKVETESNGSGEKTLQTFAKAWIEYGERRRKADPEFYNLQQWCLDHCGL